MSVKIDVRGIKKAQRYLKGKRKKVESEASDGIKKATIYLHGEVKESIAGRRAEPTSVDTGRFLNSVDFVVSKDDGVVFSNVPYAKHLEFGTTKLKARKHFSNSKDRNQREIKQIIKNQVDNI